MNYNTREYRQDKKINDRINKKLESIIKKIENLKDIEWRNLEVKEVNNYIMIIQNLDCMKRR